MSNIRARALLIALSLVGTGVFVAAPTAGTAEALTWAPCPLERPAPPDAPEGTPPTVVPVECASLDVPLDYANPSGDTVTLAVFRIRSADPATKVGHLLTNPGGPGGETKGFLAAVAGGVPEAVTSRYDLVSFDPRGIGASEGLTCGMDQDLVAELDDPVANQKAYAAALAAECLAQGGPLVATMTGTNAARDLESVRLALGDAKLTYLGYSYGATIGGTYAELFPGSVGRVVLDGATDPALPYVGWVRDQVIAFDKALVRSAGVCDADPDCAFFGATTLQVWEYLSWKARTEGLPTADGDTVGGREFESASIFASYFPDDFQLRFGAALHEALAGDASFFRDFTAAFTEGFPAGTYYAGVCGDDALRYSDYEALDLIADLIPDAPHLYWALREIFTCSSFPVSTTPLPSISLAAGETAPIVVVGNRFDAATPYAGSVAMSTAIAGSTLVTFEGGGHTIVFNGVACIDDAISAYLVDGTPPPAGLSCDPPQA